MQFKTKGQIGYEAYGDAADWKAYNDERMPQWDDLPPHIRDRWQAAAGAIEHSIIYGDVKSALESNEVIESVMAMIQVGTDAGDPPEKILQVAIASIFCGPLEADA